jgi:hypothetical protein
VAGGASLLVAGSGGLLGACGDSKAKGEAFTLYKVFQPQQPVGEKIRLPLALAAADFSLDLDHPPTAITIRLRDPAGGTSNPVKIGRRATGIPRGYYPVVVELSTAGSWTFEVEAAGQQLTTRVDARQPTELPVVTGIGDLLPRIPTPTTVTGLGVSPICTRIPPCPFHDVSLDAALARSRPIVLLVSTPAHCQTAICGPVLELLIDRRAKLEKAGVIVIHAEVYADDTAKTTTSTVDALGLTFEPSLFVTAPDGTVNARLDYTFDATELDEVLAPLVG